MGKYMRKSKISGEVVVMEVSPSSLGVRTRARTLALQTVQNSSSSATASPSAVTTSAASYIQLRSRRLEKSPRPLDPKKSKTSTRDTHHPTPLPPQENDPAVDVSFGENSPDFDSRERNVMETTPSRLIRGPDTLGTPGSSTRPNASTATNRRIQNAACRDIPTTLEMEEFFAGAEQQQKTFLEKYNYDIVNDLPLPGRYEWVRIDP